MLADPRPLKHCESASSMNSTSSCRSAGRSAAIETRRGRSCRTSSPALQKCWPIADITYIRLRQEFIYLAVLMDAFTRQIRGWHLGRDLNQGLTLAALERALLVAVPKVHHSDQGVQYAATAYVDRLRKFGVKLSMAAIGEPRENGFAERLVRTIKEEEVDLSDYRDFADAREQIGHFIDAVYNVKRIHSSLGYQTPQEFERRWRAKRRSGTTVKA